MPGDPVFLTFFPFPLPQLPFLTMLELGRVGTWDGPRGFHLLVYTCVRVRAHTYTHTIHF